MSYHLGRRSRDELKGVHPALIAIADIAIELTDQDFSVHDGLRTVDEQRENVRRGVSWTMNSMHLIQDDGYGHAMDLVPYINGMLRWEWDPIYNVVEAVRAAAWELKTPLVWGGCWLDITATFLTPEQLVERYAAKQRERGRKVTLDGPHFELA